VAPEEAPASKFWEYTRSESLTSADSIFSAGTPHIRAVLLCEIYFQKTMPECLYRVGPTNFEDINMSFFAAKNQAQHMGKIRAFLEEPKSGFISKFGLKADPAELRYGRLRVYPISAINAVYAIVNIKSGLTEKTDSSFGERLSLAQAYLGMGNAKLARHLMVSRELVRRWRLGSNRFLGDLCQLANLLQVSEKWLEFGGEEHLQANTHLGQRLGVEAKHFKELLYAETTSLISNLADYSSENELIVKIELAVFESPSLARLARRSGGRWQIQDGALHFSPWVSPPKKQIRIDKVWPIETEDVIRQELALKPSIYGAYSAIKNRCECLGVLYPALITLHKRASNAKKKELEYGVDLNMLVKKAFTEVNSQ
jgi:transcriptional regulator with XRE-family HTH domain